MTFILEQLGYLQDPVSRVWRRATYDGIAYSDGDAVEQNMARIIAAAKDLSVFSTELAVNRTDWPTRYHLSGTRANILRPFEAALKGKVLEIGAGCGAITRYLGECGGQVLALEGSPRRAAITASRTRDLNNVTVVAEKFDEFACDTKFDVITLIGVLEYANLFTSAAEPTLAMLRRVRSLLAPAGKLIIAIENQFGLKYFAGAAEDHIGQPMYGIEGRYRKDQPQTFGRVALAAQVKRVGFADAEFFVPLPDYKFPVSILTEAGLHNEKFDAAALAWQSATKDPQLTLDTTFSLERVWPEIFKNHLGLELANSFLLVATDHPQEKVPQGTLALHYSTDRRPKFCKETCFLQNDSGGISVAYRHLASAAGQAGEPECSSYRFLLPEGDGYTLGSPLSREFVDLLSRPGWALRDVSAFVARYIELLQALLEREGNRGELKSAHEKLPGRFLDAVPQNLILDAEGGVAFIDAEWSCDSGIELGHLLFRSLLLLLGGCSRVATPSAPEALTRRRFIEGALEGCRLPLAPADYSRYLELEAFFQEFVTGRPASEFMDWAPEELLAGMNKGYGRDYATLYVAPREGCFSEGMAVRCALNTRRNTVEFMLPESTSPIGLLRCDPSEQPGWHRVYTLELRDPPGNARWKWDFGPDEVESNGLHTFQDHPEKQSILLFAHDPDPQLLINLPPAVINELGPGWVLKLDLERLDSEDIVAALAERDGQIAGLNRGLAERDEKITGMNQALAERDGQIAGLLNSRSWRLTAPLRSIRYQLRRARTLWRSMALAAQRGGGVGRAASKAFCVFRTEGWQGIKRQLVFEQHSANALVVSVPEQQIVDRNDYGEWIRRYDTLTDDARNTIRKRIQGLAHQPLISVVLPTYNPKPEWLVEAIESVRKQLYPYWELCIADDASTDKAIRPVLERYAKDDARIKVVFRETNGHISAASNSALELVTGEYIALLDHDDLLAEHALFWVAEALNRHPNAQLVYSDEDKINDIGQRSDPYFKCDWNQELFYSHNMFSHLGVYSADLIRNIGGFRLGFEGSQDYDLALRCVELIDQDQIIHVPRVLYHWRVHSESTAQSSEAKPYAMLAGERAINDHFVRQGAATQVELLGFGYRARYALPVSPPLVSLIIPTRNGLRLLRQCVESVLAKTSYPNYEILIVDNGSDDAETLRYLKEFEKNSRMRVVRDDRPFNYSALNNIAVKDARGELVGLLNNDLEVISPGWLSEMVGLALQPGVGAVGARLWYPDDSLQHGGLILGILGIAGNAHKHMPRGHHGYFGRADLTQGLSAVTAACLVIRKIIYEKVGGLNEVDLQVAYNDVDFCLRVREAGYRNVWTPYADLYHHESATRGYENTPEKQNRFANEVRYMQERWGSQLLNDPAYSPNLTLEHDDFSLAWPPRVSLVG